MSTHTIDATIKGKVRQEDTSTTNPSGPSPDYLASNPWPSFPSGDGYTLASDANYATGSAYGPECRGFLGWDLTGYPGTYTSAVLKLTDPDLGDRGITTEGLHVVDLSSHYADLAAGTGGTTLFNAFASATVAASVASWSGASADPSTILNGDSSSTVQIPLGSGFLASVNAAAGSGQVALGLLLTGLSQADFHLICLHSHTCATPSQLVIS